MRLLIIAGEPSGDMRGSELLGELRLQDDSIEASGLGGRMLSLQGMELLYDLEDYAVMGFSEVLGSLHRFRKLEKGLRRFCREREPDAVLLIDYPGFNLRFAGWAHKRGIPVLYYVSPQLWAWGGWRLGKVKRCVDLMLTLFEFESDFYTRHGVNSIWAGHPLAGSGIELAAPDANDCIAVLPGSRNQEVSRLLPPMLEAVDILMNKGLIRSAKVVRSVTVDRELYEPAAKLNGVELCDTIAHAMESSSVALVCSGTATLETAMYGVPFVICYRTSTFTYVLAKLLIRGVSRIGMANIVADRDVAPELIQSAATGVSMAKSIETLLVDNDSRKMALEGLALVRRKLGPSGGAERAASGILEYLDR
jgi:lipid-A-disaccharide synthase